MLSRPCFACLPAVLPGILAPLVTVMCQSRRGSMGWGFECSTYPRVPALLATLQVFQDDAPASALVERPFRLPGSSSAPATKAAPAKAAPKKEEFSTQGGLDPRSVALPGAKRSLGQKCLHDVASCMHACGHV